MHTLSSVVQKRKTNQSRKNVYQCDGFYSALGLQGHVWIGWIRRRVSRMLLCASVGVCVCAREFLLFCSFFVCVSVRVCVCTCRRVDFTSRPGAMLHCRFDFPSTVPSLPPLNTTWPSFLPSLAILHCSVLVDDTFFVCFCFAVK